MTFCDLASAQPQTPFVHQTPTIAPPEPDPIRIYVACLAAYNQGYLHGAWIDVSDEETILSSVKAMLAESPIEEEAEEWAIHDYEGFEGAQLGEYASFGSVVELADFIRERGELGAEVLNYYGGDLDDAQTRFDEYAGAYDSLADYARELTEQSSEAIPKHLANYIDYKAMAHDYEQSGDFLSFDVDGQVHIFWAH